jgi:hypothetical protein
MIAGRAPSVSLLEQFGSDASWGDLLGCVAQALADRIRQEWTTA